MANYISLWLILSQLPVQKESEKCLGEVYAHTVHFILEFYPAPI